MVVFLRNVALKIACGVAGTRMGNIKTDCRTGPDRWAKMNDCRAIRNIPRSTRTINQEFYLRLKFLEC